LCLGDEQRATIKEFARDTFLQQFGDELGQRFENAGLWSGGGPALTLCGPLSEREGGAERGDSNI
jgi:hypothetical protein